MDVDRIERLLTDIEESLNIARSIVALGYGEFMRDVRNRYTLRMAIVEVVEAATSLGLILLRSAGVSRVESYAQVFRRLVERGVLSPRVGGEMERLARLRNLIVHRYWEVDDSRIYREARGNGLRVIEEFLREVREYVSRAGGGREVQGT